MSALVGRPADRVQAVVPVAKRNVEPPIHAVPDQYWDVPDFLSVTCTACTPEGESLAVPLIDGNVGPGYGPPAAVGVVMVELGAVLSIRMGVNVTGEERVTLPALSSARPEMEAPAADVLVLKRN